MSALRGVHDYWHDSFFIHKLQLYRRKTSQEVIAALTTPFASDAIERERASGANPGLFICRAVSGESLQMNAAALSRKTGFLAQDRN